MESGWLVFPTHKRSPYLFDCAFVTRTFNLYLSDVTVFVDLESAGRVPMPAGNGGFYGVDRMRLSESLIFFCVL